MSSPINHNQKGTEGIQLTPLGSHSEGPPVSAPELNHVPSTATVAGHQQAAENSPLDTHIATLRKSLEKARSGSDIVKSALARALAFGAGAAAVGGILGGGFGAIIGAPVFMGAMIASLIGRGHREERANDLLLKDDAFKASLKEIHNAFTNGQLSTDQKTQIKTLINDLTNEKKGYVWNTKGLSRAITGEETKFTGLRYEYTEIGKQKFAILHILHEMIGGEPTKDSFEMGRRDRLKTELGITHSPQQ